MQHKVLHNNKTWKHPIPPTPKHRPPPYAHAYEVLTGVQSFLWRDIYLRVCVCVKWFLSEDEINKKYVKHGEMWHESDEASQLRSVNLMRSDSNTRIRQTAGSWRCVKVCVSVCWNVLMAKKIIATVYCHSLLSKPRPLCPERNRSDPRRGPTCTRTARLHQRWLMKSIRCSEHC